MKQVLLVTMVFLMTSLAGCTSSESSGTEVTIIGYSEKCELNEGAAYLYINDERKQIIPESEECTTNNPSFSFEVKDKFEDGDSYAVKFTKGDQTVVCSGEITAEDIDNGQTDC